MRNSLNRPIIFLGTLFVLTFAAGYLMAGMLVFDESTWLYSAFWLFCFVLLIFNVNYMLVNSFFRLWVKNEPCPELDLKDFPKTAILYPVKNETFGLYERLRYSLSSNEKLSFDVWVLSDSSDENSLEYEKEVVNELRKDFAGRAIFYRHRPYAFERKQGNIMSWAHAHPDYDYFFVCDADTMIAPGALGRLLQKAEHPQHQNVAIFQSRLEIVHAKTYFARFQAISSRLAQKLYASVNQAVFGRQISFGHGCLIRMQPFLNLRLPKGIWSHDVWDTALLDQMGYKTVFCPDVICFDEVPADYLELLARNRRWAKGTLQSWSLLFLPGLSLATRFYVAYGIYMYLIQPVFFFWIVASFWAASASSGALLRFQRYSFLGGTLIDVELAGMAIFSLLIVFFHKMILCRSFRDFSEIIQEILFSTFICLNNVFYQTLDIVLLPFQKSSWVPAKKNPVSAIQWAIILKILWPSTVLGLAGLYFGFNESPQWAFAALPFLVSFSFIIPLTYATARINLPRLVSL